MLANLGRWLAYDPATMAQCRFRVAVRTVRRIARDLLRLLSTAVRSHAHLAAENLFLRKQLALYVERQVKPRRADDATRDRKSTRLNSSHIQKSRMPSSA